MYEIRYHGSTAASQASRSGTGGTVSNQRAANRNKIHLYYILYYKTAEQKQKITLKIE